MDKKSEMEKFLADIKQDGEPAFKEGSVAPDDTGKETPAPPAETPGTEAKPEEKGEAAPSQEGAKAPDEEVPFHKHPRWIAKNRELHELREKVERLEKAEHEPAPPKETTATLPSWWVSLYGNTEESANAYQQYEQYESSRQADIKKQILEEQRQQEAKQKEEVERWNTYIDDQIESLREQGKKFDRNKLLKVVDDYSPRDKDGNIVTLISFDKAYEILQMRDSADPEAGKARKAIAAQTAPGTKTPEPTEEVRVIGQKRDWFRWQNNP